jgi:hypothetical protein
VTVVTLPPEGHLPPGARDNWTEEIPGNKGVEGWGRWSVTPRIQFLLFENGLLWQWLAVIER